MQLLFSNEWSPHPVYMLLLIKLYHIPCSLDVLSMLCA